MATKKAAKGNSKKATNGKSARTFVLVRTYSAGVHVGELVERRGREVDLANARRIWSWKGANTLHEVSLSGVASGSRVSQPVEAITVLEAIEVIACTPEARRVIESVPWA